jgi:hypothetical protein
MSFQTQLVHRVTTYRLQSGSGMQKNYEPNLIDQAAFIQPMSAEYAQKANLVFGRAYNMYTTINVDIKNGDKVVDQDGKEFRVSGSLRRNYGFNPNVTYWLTEEAGKSTI